MKDTLRQLGYEFTEIAQDCIEISHNFNNIRIDASIGEISYDSAQEKKVNTIKQNYMVNFYRDKAIKEGMQLSQETGQNGEIILMLSR
jgi:hypothetical protein